MQSVIHYQGKNMKYFLIIVCLLLAACSRNDSAELNANYGESQVRDRVVESTTPLGHDYLNDVKPVLENRCVVCHGCYDAPCQLKLSSIEGIDRGVSVESVYATRFSEVDPTRIFIDADTTQEWRDHSAAFNPVLNERDQTPIANLQGSLMYQLLEQKNIHPLPDQKILPDSFDVSLNRNETCPTIETLSSYQEKKPLAGMPYGLPNITHSEFKVLEEWLKKGAPMAQPMAVSAEISQHVNEWEILLNQSSLKSKLVGRYIYEHLFLGHIYFPEVTLKANELPIYFRLVRSSTPPGEAIKEIATRRPYDDPEVENVYYRLRRDTGTVVSKTHMPYAFDEKRKARWNELFYGHPFTVNTLPDYSDGDNPFIVFAQIPSQLRYQFMLDEAEYTIMGFIKGPVCRGQIALSVIRDKFWVFFTNPTSKNVTSEQYDAFLVQQEGNLQLPSNESAISLAIPTWRKFSKLEQQYLAGVKNAISEIPDITAQFGIESLHAGNENAALTILRDFDSGVVLKGLHGETPKTAWVIDYPVLERVHYLLVAGYDIYGSVRHQLVTRLYMDFLRLESEMWFVSLLPKEDRTKEIQSWYIDATDDLSDYITDGNFFFEKDNSIAYTTSNPKKELLEKLKKRYLSSLSKETQEKQNIFVNSGDLSGLSTLPNIAVQQLPPSTFLLVEADKSTQGYTLIRHNAHKNVASLLKEGKMRLPELDTAELYKGFVGSYPQVIFKVSADKVEQFVTQFSLVNDALSYEKLIDNFGVRRTDANFWKVSDQIHSLHLQADEVSYGLFDYNRLENR